MVEIDSSDVERAYQAALRCLDPFPEFAEAARELKACCPRLEEAVPELPDKALLRLRSAAKALGDQVQGAAALADPIREMLHLCSKGRETFMGREAPSFLEAFLLALSEKVCNSDVDLDQSAMKLGCRFQNLANLNLWEPHGDGVRAELNIERARVKDRVRKETGVPMSEEHGLWRFEGGRVVLLGELAGLRRLSARLMRYLIQRRARLVTYQDLGVDVWDTGAYRKEAIQQAVYKLRNDLKALGCETIAARIDSDNDGYKFC